MPPSTTSDESNDFRGHELRISARPTLHRNKQISPLKRNVWRLNRWHKGLLAIYSPLTLAAERTIRQLSEPIDEMLLKFRGHFVFWHSALKQSDRKQLRNSVVAQRVEGVA